MRPFLARVQRPGRCLHRQGPTRQWVGSEADLRMNRQVDLRAGLESRLWRDRPTIPPEAGLTATLILQEPTNTSFFDLSFQSDGIGSVGTFDFVYHSPWPLKS